MLINQFGKSGDFKPEEEQLFAFLFELFYQFEFDRDDFSSGIVICNQTSSY
jgi:hypothetical protein